MTNVCFYFQVHQPYRVRKYSVFDVGNKKDYFDEQKNKQIMEKVAKKCYLPANKLILDQINKYADNDRKFKVAYSLSGVFAEQAEKYCPEVIQSFKDLAKTKKVEFLNETYHHSLSYLYSKQEFKEQVGMHKKMIKNMFSYTPKVFRNTELIFNNELAKHVESMGYKAIIAEGWDPVLGWRSPNYVYNNAYAKNIKMLLKNYKLSDDMAFRFGDKTWKEHPLTAEKFASWISAIKGDSVNLFMDYETFGEHQWEDTGIFKFMEALPEKLLNHKHIDFKTPTELSKIDSKGELDIHNFISWADVERDTSAWLGNRMQDSAMNRLYMLEQQIKKSGNISLLDSWRKLTTSDHSYYMCTKWFNDGDVHKYFNPHDSPYDAFMNFMNILNDIQIRLAKEKESAKAIQKARRVDLTGIKTQNDLFY